MNQTTENKPVSTIGSDRLCVKCSYNLRGQTIAREPHYGLHIARCPECGTPAAIQEYPILGRQTGQLRVFAAVGYFIVFILTILISTNTLTGMADTLSWRNQQYLSDRIALKWTDYVNAESLTGRDVYADMIAVTNEVRDEGGRLLQDGSNEIDMAWWKNIKHTTSPSLINIATRTKNIGSNFFRALTLFTFGCVFSVLFIAASRRVLAVLVLLPALFATISLISTQLEGGLVHGWINAHSIARYETRPYAFAVILSLWLFFGGLGLIFGRPLARLGVRALLPPTMRGSLAELWFTDNKPLPTGTRPPRTLYPETNPPHPPATPGDCDA